MHTSPNFFPALPLEILQHLFSWLNLHGPKVKLIEGDPTDEERRILTAVALNDQGKLKPDQSRPDLSTYHLIADDSTPGKIVYKIGFCNRKTDGLTYEIKILDPKSPLLRYVKEDFQHPGYSKLFDDKGQSQDPLLLKYMALEIKAAGGLTRHPLRNRTPLAAICRDANAWMKGMYTTQTQTQLFEHSIRQALLDDLLHHVAYGEQGEAKAILELDPSLLSPLILQISPRQL